MKDLPKIDIHGKDYVLVKDRVIYFNETHKDGSIVTEIIKNDSASVVVKATVTTGTKTFTGHSEAQRSKSQMGQVAIEVAETSAVGRALGMMGIGVLESVASADEILKNQPAGVQSVPTLDANAPHCVHGQMELKVSKSAKNPGRSYYACPMPNKESQCGMNDGGFIWADSVKTQEPLIDEDGDEINAKLASVKDSDLPF